MEIFRIAILLLIFCFYTVFCYPSRPLNERSTELAWQAWLLVDDQNQNKNQDLDNFTRRRITPKSVFIAPTFSPESLPACAEGYRADSMGRCIRIIKLDEEAHLDFLLQKLNAQFGNYDDDEDSQEDLPTPGPFQLNIPLNGASRPTKDAEDNLDIAIVVAPTNGNFVIDPSLKNGVKRTSVLNGDSETQENRPQNEQPILPLVEDATIEPTIVNRFLIDDGEEDTTTETTTTVLPSETPTTTTTTDASTSIPTTTIPSTETTTVQIDTDTTTSNNNHNNEHALFFLEHSLTNSEHVQNGKNSSKDTPEVSTTTDNNLTTTTDLSEGRLETTTPDLEQSESKIRFPTDVDYIKNPEKITQHDLLPNSNNVNTFEPTKTPSTEQFQALFNEYINSRGADLKGTERFIFKDSENKPKNDRYHSGHESYFNHRNRDKNSNMWTVPPSWSQTTPQKPIVFRFSRRSNGRHFLEEQIHNPREFYREVPSQEFSYFFGITPADSKQPRRRNRR
ncbi:hypothetical protein FQR65_LT00883 [Abscondita terminalis]|nr:hypothetical protein FQR65_LT00883 [Abscondita terminalis]